MQDQVTPDDALATSYLPKLAAVTLGCVMVAGFWQFTAASLKFQEMALPSTWTDFRQGRTTGTLEKQIDHRLPARADLIAGANMLRFVLTKGTGEQVRLGRGDWLFLTEELQYHPLGDSNMAARVQLLSKTSHGLAQKGVQLVVALVPDKARVHPEHWSAAGYPAYNATRYSQALTHLNQAGVMAIDLLGPLQQAAKNQSVYYRSDTHWNQVGAKVAASVIATHIASLNTQLDEATFVTTTQATAVERPGDLIRLMGLEHMPNMLRPKPDTETTEITTQTSADQATGLFGDSAVGVVLTGTSYSLRGNFHGHLQQALRTKVLNVAKDGGGLLQATGAYLADESFKTTPPKVLLWEVPERFLTLPLDKEAEWLKTTALSAPGKP
jgi:alginate O-acetyltransferase complex protein AlgJ